MKYTKCKEKRFVEEIHTPTDIMQITLYIMYTVQTVLAVIQMLCAIVSSRLASSTV